MRFANPAALLFAALYAVLIALYLWERHRRRVEVPSLLLWQAVPEEVVRSSRFRPDLLFLLQMLLLTLLIGGLAEPYLTGPGGSAGPARRIFILDTSASMQAREARRTRFDEARAALRRRLAALAPDDEAMLIAAANHPRVVAPFSRDHAALRRQLKEIRPVDTGTNLNLALAVARSAAERPDFPASIEVFTDAPPSQLDPRWREHTGVFQVGETDDNLAITGLEIFQGRFQDYREAHARVLVRNFSHREAHGFLTVRLEEQVISRRGFSLAPRRGRALLVGEFPRPGILHAHLEVDDALPADNDAYGWVRPTRPLRVLVVSDPSPLRHELETLARAVPNLEFHFSTPAEHGRAPSAAADVVLFHRHVPDAAPARPSLYLYPAGGDGWLRARGEAAEVEILDWNDEHAVLGGLRPIAALPLRRAAVLDLPRWADVLLTSRADEREIPLAFAGERDGHRTACVAFDLAAERLLSADNVNLLLFFLQLLDWLAPADDSVTVVRTGEVRILTDLPKQPRRVIDPRGRAATFPPDHPLALEALHAGEYQISADGTRRRVLANFFDAAESDIGRASREAAAPPQPVKAGTRPPGHAAALGLWLYAVAALLCVVEWLAAARET